jgi:hypothetical protein
MSIIKSITTLITTLSKKQHIAILIAISALVAIRITYIQHGWVNDDSLLYFEMARLLAVGQWHAAYDLFPWLFYPGLLALGHVATSLDIHTTAQIINIILFSLFSWGFVLLIFQAGGDYRTAWWGALLLLSTQYIVGDILGMLLRDEGFWAGLTWALLFLLRYMQNGKKLDAYYFQIAITFAMLFRVEAIAYYILPMAILVDNTEPFRKNIYKLLYSISLPLLSLVFISVGLIFGIIDIHKLGRLQEVIYLVQQGLSERLHFIQGKADLLGKQVLGHYLADYGNFAIWSTLILIVVNKTLKVTGWPVLLCLITGKKAWKYINHHVRHLFSLHIILGFITSVLIIINVFVLSSRYVIASGIVMLVIGAFCIQYLYTNGSFWIKRSLLMVMSLMLLVNLHDPSRVDLDRKAVEYIQSINSQQQPVLYDTENARFYANKPFMNRIHSRKLVESLLNNNRITDYSYLMISIGKNDTDYEQSITQKLSDLHFQPIETLYGWKHKSKVIVYKQGK